MLGKDCFGAVLGTLTVTITGLSLSSTALTPLSFDSLRIQEATWESPLGFSPPPPRLVCLLPFRRGSHCLDTGRQCEEAWDSAPVSWE